MFSASQIRNVNCPEALLANLPATPAPFLILDGFYGVSQTGAFVPGFWRIEFANA